MDFIFNPSLVLYLPLYKLDGTSLMSKDAYGHLCTVTGALWRLDGRYFDGTDDYIYRDANVSNIGGGSEITIEVWLKCDREGTREGIWSLGDVTLSDFLFISHETTKKLKIFLRNSAGDDYAAVWTSDADLPITRFVHIFITYNKNQATKLSVLLNGENWSGNDTGVGGTLNAPTTELVIGGRGEGGSHALPFSGTIGEVRVYQRAPVSIEGQHNYLATKWRYR